MTYASPSLPQKATRITSGISLALVILKLGAGLYTGSIAVFASAIDSFFDFLVSGFNSFAVQGSEKPRDEVYNYGRGKLEGLAALIEGLFILASATFIARQAMMKFFHPKPLSATGLNVAVGVMVFSTLAAMGIALYLHRISKRTRSLIIQADAAHYRMDVYSNVAILAAILIIRFTSWQLADPLLALGISLYIAKASLPLIKQGLDMLLDRALPEHLVSQIAAIATSHSPLINGAHELKTRRAGEINFVELHLVFDEHIPLGKAHRIADEIEMRIRELEKGKWSVNIHLDPVDDSPRDRRLAQMS